MSDCIVLSSNCPNGPKEILEKKNGLLFNNNSESDFLNKFNQLINLSHSEKNIIKINAKKKVQNFSIFRHYQKLYKILMD